MRLKENNQLKLISLLIAILLFLSVNEKIKNFSETLIIIQLCG